MPFARCLSVNVVFALSVQVAAVLMLGVGCARHVIPNTEVEDTAQNREVLAFVEKYRQAVEAKDPEAMLALASDRYYDDNGTPTGRDDLDLHGLQEKLRTFADNVLDVRYEIRYRRVTYDRDEIRVDYLYTGSFRIDTPDGERWSRRVADNRLVLSARGGELRILSGM